MMMLEMMKTRLTAAACCFVVAGSAIADEEHGDIEIGRTAGNQLAIVVAPDEPILLDLESAFAWSAAEPGLFEIPSTEGGFFSLDTLPNTGIRLELIASDAGFFFFTAGGVTPINAPGDFATLGLESGLIHSHPTWGIDKSVVGSDFAGVLDATFRLVDVNASGYTASENFTLQFTNVPEPGSALLLLAGTGLLAARRRRK